MKLTEPTKRYSAWAGLMVLLLRKGGNDDGGMKRRRNEGVELKGNYNHSIPGKMSF